MHGFHGFSTGGSNIHLFIRFSPEDRIVGGEGKQNYTHALYVYFIACNGIELLIWFCIQDTEKLSKITIHRMLVKHDFKRLGYEMDWIGHTVYINEGRGSCLTFLDATSKKKYF